MFNEVPSTLPPMQPHQPHSCQQERTERMLAASKAILLDATVAVCGSLLRHAAERRREQRDFWEKILNDI